ncbi:MAG TPA: phenylalanine--tRNA ligase beta subunit-related protein [Rhabdochlamydiaceae bacterium]
MQIHLEQALLTKYPQTQIGYLVAKVAVKKSDPYVEGLKTSLDSHLQELGVDATTFVTHPGIALWRRIYEEDFQVKAKTYRSSIEALLRRVVTGKEIWNICNVVDLYNCCSIFSMLPMGGYDLSKVVGDITIRFAREGEQFLPLGEWKKIDTETRHVVYADEERLLCWLWNHKDSAETCIDEHSEYVVFFMDGFEEAKVQDALKLLSDHLEKIGGAALESGVLNRGSPQARIQVSVLCDL